jgi:Rho-binding antiterminator
MSPTPYRPISCAVHDRLESYAVRRTPVTIRWRDLEGAEHLERSTISDVLAKDGEEFAVLASGPRIRLDWIVELRPEPGC